MQGAEQGVAVVWGTLSTAHSSPEVSKGEETKAGHAVVSHQQASSF